MHCVADSFFKKSSFCQKVKCDNLNHFNNYSSVILGILHILELVLNWRNANSQYTCRQHPDRKISRGNLLYLERFSGFEFNLRAAKFDLNSIVYFFASLNIIDLTVKRPLNEFHFSWNFRSWVLSISQNHFSLRKPIFTPHID